MKIAIFHELDFGGARRAVQEFSKRLKKILDIDLYYVDDKEDKNISNIYKNIYYYPFYPRHWEGSDWNSKLYKDTVELFKLYNLHEKIAKRIKSKNYDYVFVHPSKYTQAPFLLRFLNNCVYYCQEPLRIVYDPFVSDISGIKFPKSTYELLNRKIRKWIDRVNFNGAKIILSNSKFSEAFIKKSYGKLSEVCYLGVDTDFFKPFDLKKEIDVLFIGSKEIGYDLLNSLPKLFENKIRIRALFRENGKINVADDELVKIYNKSKILVALNHNEPFGLIPLEAMSCGIPVIAVSEGGYKESVINNKTGFLVPRDPNKLYEKIDKLIKNEALRQELGKNARENVLKSWTWDMSVNRLLKILNYEE